MLTQSTERFTRIQKEASLDNQHYLVQVTKFQAAKHCKVRLCSLFNDLNLLVVEYVMGKIKFDQHTNSNLFLNLTRLGFWANGQPQENKNGHHQEHTSISLWFHQCSSFEETAHIVSLQP